MALLLDVSSESVKDEYRYEREPSTRPTLPKVYDVAKLGEESEETWKRRPLGVSKSRRSAYSQLDVQYSNRRSHYFAK